MVDAHSTPGDAGADSPEVARLREELALVQRELAWVQANAEAREERLAALATADRECDQLAKILARHLSRPAAAPPTVGGVRGWLVRKLVPGLIPPPPPPPDPRLAQIEKSGLFDPAWYLRRYPDVATAGEHPTVHYYYLGGEEGRWAGPRFDTGFYRARYPDVRESGLHPLVHYLEVGKAEGRLTVQPAWEPSTQDAEA